MALYNSDSGDENMQDQLKEIKEKIKIYEFNLC